MKKPGVEESDLPRHGLNNLLSSPVSSAACAEQLLTAPVLQRSHLACYCIGGASVTAILPVADGLWICDGVIVENVHKRVQRADLSTAGFSSFLVTLQEESRQHAPL